MNDIPRTAAELQRPTTYGLGAEASAYAIAPPLGSDLEVLEEVLPMPEDLDPRAITAQDNSETISKPLEPAAAHAGKAAVAEVAESAPPIDSGAPPIKPPFDTPPPAAGDLPEPESNEGRDVAPATELQPQVIGYEAPVPQLSPREREALLGKIDLLDGIDADALYHNPEEEVSEASEDEAVGYDLRKHAQQQLETALKQIRGDEAALAAKHGIKIAPEDLAAWRPGPGQIEALRGKLQHVRGLVTVASGIATFIADQQAEALRRGVKLMPNQQEGERALLKFVLTTQPDEFGGLSGAFKSPPGSGKTGMFARFTAAMKHYEDPAEPQGVLVLTPTQQLRGQTVGVDGEKGYGKFTPDLEVDLIESTADEQNEDGVGVMCTQLFNSLYKQGKLANYKRIIVDEAHLAIGPQTAKNLREYARGKLLLGLTATDKYDEDRTIYDLFEHSIYKMDIPTGIRRGILAPTRGFLIDARPKINEADLPKDRAARNNYLRAAYREARELHAMDVVREELKRGYGVMVRCQAGNDIAAAIAFADRLNKEFGGLPVRNPETGGIRLFRARHVGGKKQGSAEKESLLRLADQGEITVLTYVQGVGTGTDVQRVKTVIDMPSESQVAVEQNGGRGMRLLRDQNGDPVLGRDGKPIPAHVYNYVDPWLGDRQYTILNALGNVKSGELVTKDEHYSPPPIPHRRHYDQAPVAIEGITATVVGSTALDHQVAVEIDDSAVTKIEIPITPTTPVREEDGIRMLGVNQLGYHSILRSVGSNPAEVTYGDIELLRELYPKLQVQPCPASGYQSATHVAARIGGRRRPITIMRIAREFGIRAERFIGPDGYVDYFYPDEIADELTEYFREDS